MVVRSRLSLCYCLYLSADKRRRSATSLGEILADLEALGVASYIYVKFGPEQLSFVRLLCSFPFVVESLRERTLSRLLKMPLHSFETVLRRTHEIVIGATTRDGITTTDIRRAGKPVLLVRDDAFGTIMSALRQEIAERVDIDITRFPLAPLTVNGIKAVTFSLHLLLVFLQSTAKIRTYIFRSCFWN